MTGTLNNVVPLRDIGPAAYVPRVQSKTASFTLDGSYDGVTNLIDAAAGLTATLPKASGTGARYRFLIKTTVTSNSVVIKVANAVDAFNGFSQSVSDDPATVKGFIAAAGSDDTVTFNGTTTGGYVGDEVVVEDIASGLFQVTVRGKQTGTEATPFSATV